MSDFNFFEVIFTLIGIYLAYRLVRFLTLYVYPAVREIRRIRKIQRDFNKTAERERRKYNQNNDLKTVYREKDLSVEKPVSASKKMDDEKLGEYIDFEDMK